jgi:hypothetical protein
VSDRIKTLLGYQIVNKVNMGNSAMFNISEHFRGDHEVKKAKDLAEGSCKVVDIEVDTRLREFLGRFPDPELVVSSLKHFNVQASDVVRDKDEILTHTPNARNVVALVDDKPTLKRNGDLLSLYKERVTLHIDPETISQEYTAVNIYQDLLNAAAFELKGICSYRGEPYYHTVKERRDIVDVRFHTAEQINLPDTAEVRCMEEVARYVTDNLPTAQTLDDLAALGVYIDSHVPQLPLLRRWWQHG